MTDTQPPTQSPTQTLLICGGRDYGDYDYFKATLDQLKEKGHFNNITKIISGGSSGADTLAERWAKENNYPLGVFKADWKLYGNKAGPIRNSEMIAIADMVVAYPTVESKGTYDTINKARKKGIPVHIRGRLSGFPHPRDLPVENLFPT